MSSSISDDLLILLDSEDSGFSQSSPATGTLYTAAADGTFIWSVEQPASPDYLDRLNGGFRVQDLKSDGLGAVNNGWEWQLEYQVNGTWTFSWYSVTAGTKSAAIQTQTNIGSVTNVRVILDGNSLAVATSANGVSYTSRGSTTSATYQAQTGISSSYTGADGTELYTVANALSISNEANASTGITATTVSKAVEAVDVFDGSYAIEISDNTIGFGRGEEGLGAYADEHVVISIAHKKGTGTSQQMRFHDFVEFSAEFETPGAAWAVLVRRATVKSSSAVYMYPNFGSISTDSILADALSIQAIGALDASGDGGFSQVVQS